mmetsp:Transcript_18712/g.40722  ORF Transcript_18712/g.40722 Transcript_18712/m.40722 type:complete len:215 (+) Transcript_18712:702-1346(+)
MTIWGNKAATSKAFNNGSDFSKSFLSPAPNSTRSSGGSSSTATPSSVLATGCCCPAFFALGFGVLCLPPPKPFSSAKATPSLPPFRLPRASTALLLRLGRTNPEAESSSKNCLFRPAIVWIVLMLRKCSRQKSYLAFPIASTCLYAFRTVKRSDWAVAKVILARSASSRAEMGDINGLRYERVAAMVRASSVTPNIAPKRISFPIRQSTGSVDR